MKNNFLYFLLLFNLVLLCNRPENNNGILAKRILSELNREHSCLISDSILNVNSFDTEIIYVLIKKKDRDFHINKWDNVFKNYVNSDTSHCWSTKFNNSFIQEINSDLIKNDSCMIAFSQIGYDSISQYGIIKFDYDCGVRCGNKGYILFKFVTNNVKIIKYLISEED